ncbi:MAG: NAD(P)H-binding protein [Actinobacteria bacterium]|nr:NAD(P)H-binding protein [Actinomycetota bacterium]
MTAGKRVLHRGAPEELRPAEDEQLHPGTVSWSLLAATEQPIAVLGATGYTGSLVCEQLRELGLPVRLLGRRREELEQRAQSDEEIAVADVTDWDSLAEALQGAFAVISTAGPFLQRGFATVDAAITCGVHYLDSSTEQAYSRQIYERFGGRAAEAGIVLLTAFANAPGDFAAGIAADGLEGPLEDVVVATEQSGFVFSRGSRETLAQVLEQPQAAWEDGRLVPSRFGSTTKRVRFPSGEHTVVEWGGPEPLTVPRHVEVRRVRAYVKAPRVAAATGKLASRLAPLVRLSARVGRPGPPPAKRRKSTCSIVAEATGPGGGRRATLIGRDVYGVAALVLARGVQALRDGEARAAGALAPAEAFEPRAFVTRLGPLVQLESLVDL